MTPPMRPLAPMWLVALCFAGVAVTLTNDFVLLPHPAWQAAFGGVAVVVAATAVWWKSRFLRAFSLSAFLAVAIVRAGALMIWEQAWPPAISWALSAVLAWYAWPHLLPPCLDVTDVLDCER